MQDILGALRKGQTPKSNLVDPTQATPVQQFIKAQPKRQVAAKKEAEKQVKVKTKAPVLKTGTVAKAPKGDYIETPDGKFIPYDGTQEGYDKAVKGFQDAQLVNKVNATVANLVPQPGPRSQTIAGRAEDQKARGVVTLPDGTEIRTNQFFTQMGNRIADQITTAGSQYADQVNPGGDNALAKFILGHASGIPAFAAQAPLTALGGIQQLLDPQSTANERVSGLTEAGLELGGGKIGSFIGKLPGVEALGQGVGKVLNTRIGGPKPVAADLTGMADLLRQAETTQVAPFDALKRNLVQPKAETLRETAERFHKETMARLGSQLQGASPAQADEIIRQMTDETFAFKDRLKKLDQGPPVATEPVRTKVRTKKATTKAEEFAPPTNQTSDGSMSYLDNNARAQLNAAEVTKLKALEGELLAKKILNPVEKETLIRIRKRLGSKAAPTPEEAAAAAERTRIVNAGRATTNKPDDLYEKFKQWRDDGGDAPDFYEKYGLSDEEGKALASRRQLERETAQNAEADATAARTRQVRESVLANPATASDDALREALESQKRIADASSPRIGRSTEGNFAATESASHATDLANLKALEAELARRSGKVPTKQGPTASAVATRPVAEVASTARKNQGMTQPTRIPTSKVQEKPVATSPSPVKETVTAKGGETGKPWSGRVYHGTGTGFSEYDAGLRGTNTGSQSATKATFFTDDGEAASAYADMASEKINSAARNKEIADWDAKYEKIIDKLYEDAAKNNDPDLVRQAMDLTATRPSSPDFDPAWLSDPTRKKGANVRIENVSMRNPMVVDFGGGPRDRSFSDLIDEAKAAGHDGVIFKNVYDDPIGKKPINVYATFDAPSKPPTTPIAEAKGPVKGTPVVSKPPTPETVKTPEQAASPIIREGEEWKMSSKDYAEKQKAVNVADAQKALDDAKSKKEIASPFTNGAKTQAQLIKMREAELQRATQSATNTKADAWERMVETRKTNTPFRADLLDDMPDTPNGSAPSTRQQAREWIEDRGLRKYGEYFATPEAAEKFGLAPSGHKPPAPFRAKAPTPEQTLKVPTKTKTKQGQWVPSSGNAYRQTISNTTGSKRVKLEAPSLQSIGKEGTVYKVVDSNDKVLFEGPLKDAKKFAVKAVTPITPSPALTGLPYEQVAQLFDRAATDFNVRGWPAVEKAYKAAGDDMKNVRAFYERYTSERGLDFMTGQAIKGGTKIKPKEDKEPNPDNRSKVTRAIEGTESALTGLSTGTDFTMRGLDTVAGMARSVAVTAESAIRAPISRLQARNNPMLRQEAWNPSKWKRALGGTKEFLKKEAADVLAGLDEIELDKMGGLKTKSKLAKVLNLGGLSDVPTRHIHYHMALDDFAGNLAERALKTRKGVAFEQSRRAILDDLRRGKAPTGVSDTELKELLDAAMQSSLDNTYNNANKVSEVLDSINRMTDSGKFPGSQEVTAASKAGLKMFMRFSKVLTNVGLDQLNRGPAGLLEGGARSFSKDLASGRRGVDILAKGVLGTGGMWGASQLGNPAWLGMQIRQNGSGDPYIYVPPMIDQLTDPIGGIKTGLKARLINDAEKLGALTKDQAAKLRLKEVYAMPANVVATNLKNLAGASELDDPGRRFGGVSARAIPGAYKRGSIIYDSLAKGDGLNEEALFGQGRQVDAKGLQNIQKATQFKTNLKTKVPTTKYKPRPQ